ncbi:unnamed protein product [Mesocestoides corti]|uniref:V-type proton ATPase subunit S1 n=2 Tax=Mesocestoides corti TaxID=53468 RepID=A0A0R3UP65_MESCO|nr:unnamed protein product [Mesocestoides corti]
MLLLSLTSDYFLIVKAETPNVDSENYIYFNVSGCLAFFARRIDVIIADNPSVNFTIKPVLTGGNCGNGNMSSLSFSANTSSVVLPAVDFSFQFASYQNGYWGLDSSKAMYNATTYKLAMEWPQSPISMGFKCSNMAQIVALNSTPRVEFSFTGLQVQPFGISDGIFTEATDCIGFLSSEILSSLLVTFLLLGIFTYGLVMVMGIQTNDSFDDPKHKVTQIFGTTD